MKWKWPSDFSQDFNKKVREVLLMCSWQYSRKRTIGRTYNIHIWPFFYLQVENHWIQTLNLNIMTHVFYHRSTGEQPWVKMKLCYNPRSADGNMRKSESFLGPVFNFKPGCFWCYECNTLHSHSCPHLDLETRPRFCPLSLRLCVKLELKWGGEEILQNCSNLCKCLVKSYRANYSF